jgi:hypothetical protein
MMLMLATAMVASTAWLTYTNVRYGYAMCYPAGVLRPQPEADSGDGRKFVGANGAELFVFGQWNVEDASLSDWATDEVQSFTGKRSLITYRAARPNWLVLSGTDGGRFDFYTKTIKRSDEFVMFQLKYPAAQTRVYRPIVDRLSHCLTLTTLPS